MSSVEAVPPGPPYSINDGLPVPFRLSGCAIYRVTFSFGTKTAKSGATELLCAMLQGIFAFFFELPTNDVSVSERGQQKIQTGSKIKWIAFFRVLVNIRPFASCEFFLRTLGSGWRVGVRAWRVEPKNLAAYSRFQARSLPLLRMLQDKRRAYLPC